MNDIDEVWRDLVTAALLGTDRRDPPSLPDGLLADVVDDAVRPDPGARMLAAVAVVAAARRAAFVPLAPVTPLQPPPPDDRPLCSPASTATWRRVVSEWPVLEDEWMLTVIELGFRLGPDLSTDMLIRHRSDPVRRARVSLAGGPITGWLVDHVPSLQAASQRTVAADAVASLPELAIPPELAELLTLDAHTFVARLMPVFESDTYGPAHRAVLVNLFARCRPAVLADTAAALDRVGTGLAVALADLARLRGQMLAELVP